MWKPDIKKEFRINPEIIKKSFDVHQGLNFNEDSARLEETAILNHICITPEMRVLDLGCGNGRWANICSLKRVKYYLGIDFSIEFIRKNREKFRYNPYLVFIDMPAQRYRELLKFDLIFIIGLITYMNDDEIVEMSNNCKQMLKDGGRIVLRNVTIKGGQAGRMVYDREDYQVIRRSPEMELEFFNQFKLLHKSRIEGTGYIFYILE